MTTDGEPQHSEWEKNTGLNEDTAYVVLYPARLHAEEGWPRPKNRDTGVVLDIFMS